MNRKEFLKRSTAALAAISLGTQASTASAQQETSSITFNDGGMEAAVDRPVTVVIAGYGNRGSLYGGYASTYPKSLKVVGVADINDYRKNRAARQFSLDTDKCFGDWSELLNAPKMADAIFITLPDALHYDCCLKALEKGYHILLEKPVAQTAAQCLDILEKSKQSGRVVGICHVLRYAPYFITLKEAITSKKIGDVVSIQHLEAIECVHMAHSFVRGNWSNSKIATPMIISKSCHDLDILRWLVDAKCDKVSAFGSLKLFRKENAPEGAPKRCLDGCPQEATCPFSAKHIYMDKGWWIGVFDNLSADKEVRQQQLRKYLSETDYGKCVYFSNNDQCDNYAMGMSFANGVTVGFQMEGLTSAGSRFTRIQGTKGDIVGDMRNFTITYFRSRKQEKFSSPATDSHGGGDWRLVRDFVRAVSLNDPSQLTSSIDASIESHLMGFAAEESRARGEVVSL